VVNLTEWPAAILGAFDPEFLELPEEVLVTVTRPPEVFCGREIPGQPSPHFLAVLNTDGDPDGIIRHGTSACCGHASRRPLLLAD
jgi:glycyl-tRNA synthetase beta chain